MHPYVGLYQHNRCVCKQLFIARAASLHRLVRQSLAKFRGSRGQGALGVLNRLRLDA